jgi:hypothetical protein
VLQAGIKAMQKETAADKRLEEAARLKKEAEAALAAARAPAQDPNQDGRTQPAKAGATTVEQLTDQDYLETVKKVQYGTPEEASAALKSLVSKAATSGQTEELTMAHVAEMLDFREAMSWAQDEFKDILGDPKLKALFSGEEKRMRAAGDNRPYREVYEEIGNGLRGWRDGFKATPAPAAEELQGRSSGAQGHDRHHPAGRRKAAGADPNQGADAIRDHRKDPGSEAPSMRISEHVRQRMGGQHPRRLHVLARAVRQASDRRPADGEVPPVLRREGCVPARQGQGRDLHLERVPGRRYARGIVARGNQHDAGDQLHDHPGHPDDHRSG